MHSLLVHALGLHSLDQTEKVLVWNRGGPRTQIRRGAALIVYPRGLERERERDGGGQREERGETDERVAHYIL